MKRETVNIIRFVLEDIVPPLIRDSFLGRWVFKLYWGDRIDQLAAFRRKAPFITADEYEAVYRGYPRIQDETDNSKACLDAIAEAVVGPSVCDIGCGTGYLLKHLSKGAQTDRAYTGVDFIIDEDTRAAADTITWVEAPVESLPFDDNQFDTVICTHVLEHVLDIHAALRELRRITAKRLILVVPRERELLYTFNPHLHFFPYRHSFMRVVAPQTDTFVCEDIGRDIFYWEDF